MLTRIAGELVEVGEASAVVRLPGTGVYLEVFLPAYLAGDLAARAPGSPVDLWTLTYLESRDQGASYLPRVIGFDTRGARGFFDLLTRVKGLGTKRALRALAQPPARIAAAVARRDADALRALPEIGKRLAETIIAELHGKVDEFALLDGAVAVEPKGGAGRDASSPHAEAVAALVALGEARADAEAMVLRALARDPGLETGESILAAALAEHRA
jgi:Holliday junction DNA helicase RuvA